MAKNSDTFKVTLPADRDNVILMTRIFNAPPELVYKAYSTPELVAKWWGWEQNTTIIDVMDFQPGGKWRYYQTIDGKDEAFRGEYKEIVPNEKITYTFEYEGYPGHICTETIEFIAQEDGTTLLRNTSVYDSKEERDGMIESGMEDGARHTWDRLEDVAEGLKAV